MSVRTIADESLESAKLHVEEALKDLEDIVIGKCWGSDDMDLRKIKKNLHVLLDIEW